MRVVFADLTYGRKGLRQWIDETFGWVLRTVLRPVDVPGFVVLLNRWIVEQTFG